MQLPCGCTVEDIRNAASARVNIVVNAIALPLAEKMQERFGIPYVFFNKFTDPDRIYAAYRRLFEALALPLPAALETLYQQAKAAAEASKPALQGITYIYGNTPFDCLEFNQFMVSLGMLPQIIQTVSVEPERDKLYPHRYPREIRPLRHQNRQHCPAPIGLRYPPPEPLPRPRVRRPPPEEGDRDGPQRQSSSMLGFEITGFIAGELARAANESREYQKEVRA